jgi:MFS family permease
VDVNVVVDVIVIGFPLLRPCRCGEKQISYLIGMEILMAATPRRKVPSTTVVLILLCAMYFINYVVRVNVSTAAAVFQPELGLTNTQVGLIFSMFAYPYLLFQIIGGWVSDRFGARKALTFFAAIWSAATVFMGLTSSLAGMLFARVMVGLGVSALPTATRAMSDWSPVGKRAFAQGITHSFARIGNAVTPSLVAWLLLFMTWRGSFVLMGMISFLWAIVWIWYFRDNPAEHPAITPEDLARLPKHVEKKKRPVPVGPLVRRMFPVTVVYFCYGWTLWFFLAWIPSYFLHSHQLKLSSSALFSSGVFLGGVLGDALGGIVSDRIFEKTGDRKKARRNIIIFGFLCATVLMIPVLFIHNLTLVVLCLSAAFFFAEFTVGPFWAIPMDIAPRYSGFASGFMNSGSALAAIVSSLVGGYIVDKTGNWELTFVAGICLLVLGSILALWMKPEEELAEPTVSPTFGMKEATP